ncbi:MAG: VOC family protein [Candidatus Nanohaloarchaea archaeon]|nr:VOC family protein [Candidatus Nanohaloarchaea archaeon]
MDLDRAVLRVDDLDEVRPFYRDGLDLDWQEEGASTRLEHDGEPFLLLEEGGERSRGTSEAGLFHVALRFGDRTDLAASLRSLRGEGFELQGSADHIVSEALYLQDPAGNGVELYRDRPREEWEYDADGNIRMRNRALDVDELLSDLQYSDGGYSSVGLGHVHLEVLDLDASLPFYRDTLSLDVQARLPGALFMGWEGYHHHIGLNTWNRRRERHHPASRGLARVVLAASEEELEQVRDGDEGMVEEREDSFVITDPSGIKFLCVTSDD